MNFNAEIMVSRQLVTILGALHLLALFVLLLMFPAMFWVVKLVLVLMILISGGYFYRLYVSRVLNKSVIRILCEGGQWKLESKRELQEVTLKENSFISSWLVILHFANTENVVLPVILLPDSTDTESFRQLKVYLRTGFK